VDVGSGRAVEDGTGRPGLVGLADADGEVGVGAVAEALGAGLAGGAGDGEPASCRASAMIRADRGESWPLAWPL
jgi:hypothetical protein